MFKIADFHRRAELVVPGYTIPTLAWPGDLGCARSGSVVRVCLDLGWTRGLLPRVAEYLKTSLEFDAGRSLITLILERSSTRVTLTSTTTVPNTEAQQSERYSSVLTTGTMHRNRARLVSHVAAVIPPQAIGGDGIVRLWSQDLS